MSALEPHLKLWIEDNGRLLMSDYRVRLLELIAETGSLARAAATLSLSYRRAWGKLKELERNLGMALVSSEVGGPGGGRTSLTPAGKALVSAYEEFSRRTQTEVKQAFDELLLPALTAEASAPPRARR